MQLNLDRRVFVVTGAAQGIGAAIVESLVAEGATVAAIDIDADGLGRLNAQQSVTCHSGDLGSPDSAHAICKEVIDQHGHVDGLVTAAGGVEARLADPWKRSRHQTGRLFSRLTWTLPCGVHKVLHLP